MATFKQLQHSFVAHIKDPENNAFIQNIESRRLNVYQDLMFNNILGFLNSGFPVLASLYQSAEWTQLARQFFSQHECQSPYFTDISLEFVRYLSDEHKMRRCDPPFLAELAHYEWLELSIGIRQSEHNIKMWDGQSDINTFMLSPFASVVSYQYPVHQISPSFQPDESTEKVFLVVYRDIHDEVNFVLLNQLTAHLLTLVPDTEFTDFTSLKASVYQSLPQFDQIILEPAIEDVVKQMLTKQILIIQ